MGLLDIFSGEKGRNAAIWGAGQQAAGTAQQADYINTGAGLSLAALGQANKTAYDHLYGEQNTGELALGTGLEKSYGQLLQADELYAPLGAEANQGFSAYGDAAGVNGAAGQARARSNFQTGPGYQFMVDQGTQAATRAANATGMGASGNTLDATTRLGANLANQEWGSYVNRLNPYLNLAPQIAGRRADNRTNIAGLYTGYAKDYANLTQGYGNTLASLDTGLGTNQANIYTGQGQNLSNITGAGTASQLGLGQAGFQAGQTADANTWNAGMQVANLAAGALGKVKNPFG